MDCSNLASMFQDQRASFVLVRIDNAAALREQLRRRGWAVRRGDTFPGLGPDWLRIAVRDIKTTAAFLNALRIELSQPKPTEE